jgi:phosphopantetheine--protein transferase-like protein
MRSFKNTYYEIKQGHDHTLKFLNSSIAFIDALSVQKRLDKKGEHAYDDFLSDWEHSYIHELKIPKRKMDFLCGRLAGKRAVRRHLLKNYHSSMNIGIEHPSFRDIEIKRTVTGRPAVFIKNGASGKDASRNGTSDYFVSISHTEGVAASLVSSKMDCKGIGIDIEKIEERDNSLFNVAFTDFEIDRLKKKVSQLNGDGAQLLAEEIARYWSIKEAVMKAMGVGVNINLKDIEVKDTDGYSTVIDLKDEALDRYNLLKGADIKAESTKIEEFMVSIACLY